MQGTREKALSMLCFAALNAREIVLTKRPGTKKRLLMRHSLINRMRQLRIQAQASVLEAISRKMLEPFH